MKSSARKSYLYPEAEEQEEAGHQQVHGAQTERQLLVVWGGHEELGQEVLLVPQLSRHEAAEAGQPGHHGQVLLLRLRQAEQRAEELFRAETREEISFQSGHFREAQTD